MEKKKMEQTKPIAIIILVLIIVLGGSYYASELKGCSKKDTTSTNTSQTTTTTDDSDIPTDQQKELTNIDIEKYLSLKKQDEYSIIYIARPTCTYCQKQEPIMKNIVYEYDITVNYLNTDELDDAGQSKLIKSDDYFKEGYGTPLTLIVKNNEIVDKKEGLTSKEGLVEMFKKYNFIQE